MNHSYAVIMAGGGGTRLWPLSRRQHPKHVLPIFGDRTLFQSTLDRLSGLVPPERTLVVTTAEQEGMLKSQAASIPRQNFLIEPQPRGTASVVGLAATVLAKNDPQAVMLVLPSDHFIRRTDTYQKTIRLAVDVARCGYLVTLGIPPTFPSTGYGYIQQGDPLEQKFSMPVFRVKQFTEKPDEASARSMMMGGDHSWNSGMFIWTAGRILDEFSQQMPALASGLKRIGDAWGTTQQESVIQEIWQGLKSESIDYGIMENARDVAVLPARGLEWNDVGAWDALFDVLPADENGNVVVHADHLPIETKGSLVFSSGKKLIATLGVEDLVIIETEDALLICRRDQTQQVRKVIDGLKHGNKQEYL